MKTPLTASSGTDCKEPLLLFQDLGARNVVADFTGGTLSSAGGALLLRQADAGLGLTQSLAECFRDGREQVYVDHTVPPLVAQRTYGLALGCEDLKDHEWLRLDPLLATACDKRDPLGAARFNPAHRGVALAAPSTLNRLELSNNKRTRAHQLTHDPRQIEACLLQRDSKGTQTRPASRRRGSMWNCTARAGRWKTCSSSRCWICGPTG